MPKVIVFLIVLVGLGAAGIAVYFSLRKDRPTEPPDLTLLNESLRRTMQGEIGNPLLTQNLVKLTVARQNLDSEIARIKDLAAKFGGTVSVNHLAPGSDQDLLAEVPQAAVQPFIEAVENRTGTVLPDSPDLGEKTQVIEVKLNVGD
jgi:hypothetical protein